MPSKKSSRKKSRRSPAKKGVQSGNTRDAGSQELDVELPGISPIPRGGTAGGTPRLSKQEREKADRDFEEAQKLIEKARTQKDRKRVLKLALQAIQLDPGISEAHYLAANAVDDPLTALDHYMDGVNVIAKEMDPEFFQAHMGRLWDLFEGREMLVGMLGVAQCFQAMGAIGMAIKQYEFILGLDDQDNLEIRYPLFTQYLLAGRLEEAEELLEECKGDLGITFVYGRPLLTLMQKPFPSRLSGQLVLAIHAAMDANPYVYKLLLQQMDLPKSVPDIDPEPGSIEEAMHYLNDSLILWHAVPGALEAFEEIVAERNG